MKRTTTMVIFFFLFSTVIFGLVGNSVEAKTTTLKFATFFSPKMNLQVDVWEPLAKKVKEQSNGRLQIKIYPGGSLGKPGDHYSIAEMGIADISYILHDYSPGRFPMTTVFELPFMATTATETSMAMWKTFEEEPGLQKEYGKVKVLGLFCHPPGHFNTTKQPIRRIEDLKGMKIRTVSPAVTDALKIFNAIPVDMPITETYTSLERGVVDGTVIDWVGFQVFKFGDLIKYTTETDFYVVTMAVVMNKRKYDRLPDDLKKILDENTGLALSKACGESYDRLKVPFRAKAIEQGIEIIQLPEAEKDKLRQQTMVQREKWVETMNAKELPGQKVLDTALKNLNK